MRFRDVVWYYNYTRMMPDSFDELLNLIEPIIRKQETNCRKPIPPAIRLLITLRYLASGDLMSSLAMSYRLGKSTVSGIIQETCEAIWETLQHRVLFQPSQQRWKEIADDFSRKWNFPHCIGAIDGKHVVIQAPPYAGSTFYNYKGQHSIVLMAIVSASYEFLMVDIGAQGRHHDGGIFKGSIMGQRFENRQMELPPPCSLPNSNILVPYILVGDAAFQLNEYTLRPYPGNRLNRIREIFNKRLSRARRVVENAFGIMASKWRIYRKPINASLKTIESIVKATVCLHNFLLSTPYYANSINTCQNFVQENATAFENIRSMGSNTHSRLAAQIRDIFAQYFVEVGSVPWQDAYVLNAST
ncbi:protein ANTAGONIST OF LIKE HETEROCHROMATIN PROTEIN 1-like [Temnothorax curvispinosus]|uniref:Protein ANTAGONIST OF LIKE HETEROCHROMATIN PROTEIN 1-like n=1 Tax=Temnothorax curvispinosus TaxID=300111 RepID=A0A6J1QW22_9HYME|nr:protein ANTAGONIST OF LIKE HETEROCHROMATIN PROTEIN 1-like [Temnothorax curvispinosus]